MEKLEDVPKYFCKVCGKEIKEQDTICPHCNSDLSKRGKLIKLRLPQAGLGLTGHLSIKTIKERYEKNPKILSLVIVITIISPFIGLFLTGVLGLIIGIVVGLIAFYLGFYARTKVREIKQYK